MHVFLLAVQTDWCIVCVTQELYDWVYIIFSILSANYMACTLAKKGSIFTYATPKKNRLVEKNKKYEPKQSDKLHTANCLQSSQAKVFFSVFYYWIRESFSSFITAKNCRKHKNKVETRKYPTRMFLLHFFLARFLHSNAWREREMKICAQRMNGQNKMVKLL